MSEEHARRLYKLPEKTKAALQPFVADIMHEVERLITNIPEEDRSAALGVIVHNICGNLMGAAALMGVNLREVERRSWLIVFQHVIHSKVQQGTLDVDKAMSAVAAMYQAMSCGDMNVEAVYIPQEGDTEEEVALYQEIDKLLNEAAQRARRGQREKRQ